ncbi:MAG TPA: type II toxin-antitoxin system VapC family toxin [Streptosporangiaceae bacterium]|nr:type II toxin-antitoxin system VapC family toxin [Streptosporangiaceae bacterium]
MIYIDTSALLKLVHPEPESAPLRAWLADHPGDLVSSALVRTETRRALLRNDPGVLPSLPAVLSVIAQIPVSEAILDAAAMLPDPMLRSLDAIHLASAQAVAAVTTMLAYDKRLADASRLAGFSVVSPA